MDINEKLNTMELSFSELKQLCLELSEKIELFSANDGRILTSKRLNTIAIHCIRLFLYGDTSYCLEHWVHEIIKRLDEVAGIPFDSARPKILTSGKLLYEYISNSPEFTQDTRISSNYTLALEGEPELKLKLESKQLPTKKLIEVKKHVDLNLMKGFMKDVIGMITSTFSINGVDDSKTYEKIPLLLESYGIPKGYRYQNPIK